MSRAEVSLAVRLTVRDNPEAPGGKAAIPIYRGSARKGTREFTGRVAVLDRNSDVTRWRTSVFREARPGGRPVVSPVLSGPLVVRVMFSITRPVSVSVKRRPFPSVRPDIDNLVKPTHDALTDAGLWKDDALIVSSISSKAYVGEFHVDGTRALNEPGCVIDVFQVLPPSA